MSRWFLRLRFGAGVALGAILGIWLGHGFVADARRRLAASRDERSAIVAARGLASLLTGAERERIPKLVPAWQAGSKGISQVQVIRGTQLEASTASTDAGDRAAPRRLAREEKPLYDQAQRISTSVQTNRDEGAARKAEVELDRLPGNRLAVAAPLEAGSAPAIVRLETAALPGVAPVGWALFLAALIGAVAAFLLLSLVVGERRVALAVVALVCVAGAFVAIIASSSALVESEERATAAAIEDRLREQTALTGSLAATPPDPSRWDADVYQRPRQPEAGASELRRALLSVGGLSLVLTLLTGFGAVHWLGSTLRRNRQAYLYIAPAILGMLVLVFYPFSYGITLSFTDSNIYNTNRSIPEIWVGLRNYLQILGDFAFVRRSEAGFLVNYANFYWTLLFTIVWTISNVTIGVSVGLFLALVLNTRDLAFRPIYRVLLILPWAVPNYITALIWKGMFHQQFGVINHVIQMFGAPAVNWFDRPLTSFLTALATNGWLSFPFMMVVSLGALQSIPADLYEAARVDGATRWQQFRAITLPSLRPALVPAIILSVVWTFNMFNIIYLVTAGEPGGATEILVTQAYKYAFERYRYGYAAAYSTVIFGILLVYGVLQNRIAKATEA